MISKSKCTAWEVLYASGACCKKMLRLNKVSQKSYIFMQQKWRILWETYTFITSWKRRIPGYIFNNRPPGRMRLIIRRLNRWRRAWWICRAPLPRRWPDPAPGGTATQFWGNSSWCRSCPVTRGGRRRRSRGAWGSATAGTSAPISGKRCEDAIFLIR